MLKKLKMKFIAVIMTIVTVLLAAVFGCVMYLTKQNIENDSIQMMRALSFRPELFVPGNLPEAEQKNLRLPFFTVMVGKDGELNALGDSYYDLNDKLYLNDLINAVFSRDKQLGILSEYDLRYLVTYTDGTKSIVFADISSEKATMNSLLRNCVIIGIIGYAAFFVISMLLAKWVTKPVEKTWKEQKQFIADASHELKTPLTVIMTNAEMLEDDDYNESDKCRFTQNILVMSKRMRALVESLLVLAKMDSGSAAAYQIIDYSKLVSDSVLPFEPLFYEKGMDIICDIDSGVRVFGDRAKLEQVMDILLDNAMKYSEDAAPIKIILRRHRTHCILSVSGKGEPISKSDLNNIFKRFYRIDKARSDRQSYGLGLSIADSIIGEHNGRIWAESESGHNTFYVSLTVSEKSTAARRSVGQ